MENMDQRGRNDRENAFIQILFDFLSNLPVIWEFRPLCEPNNETSAFAQEIQPLYWIGGSINQNERNIHLHDCWLHYFYIALHCTAFMY